MPTPEAPTHRSRSRVPGAAARLLGLLMLLAFSAACEEALKSDLPLSEEEIAVRERVGQALAGGRPDLAQEALLTFARRIDAAETRGLASPEQIQGARVFVDEATERIVAMREDQQVARIEGQVEIYLTDAKFGQARRYVRASLDQLDPSARVGERLDGLIERIESARIDALEKLVEQELERGAFELAGGRVERALEDPELSEPGRQRLRQLQARIAASRWRTDSMEPFQGSALELDPDPGWRSAYPGL